MKNVINEKEDGRKFKEATTSLVGKVFVRGDTMGSDEVIGYQSIHFTKDDGFYISYEHNDLAGRKFDDGTPWPSKMPLKDASFDPTRRIFHGTVEFGSLWARWGDKIFCGDDRIFCGAVKFGGSWSRWGDQYVSCRYTLVFDTQFVCVLSGDSVYNTLHGERTKVEHTFGKDCLYTINDMSTINNEETIIWLQIEGATNTTLHPFRKYRCRLCFDGFFLSDEKVV